MDPYKRFKNNPRDGHEISEKGKKNKQTKEV
jgi:hypothetical protein